MLAFVYMLNVEREFVSSIEEIKKLPHRWYVAPACKSSFLQ